MTLRHPTNEQWVDFVRGLLPRDVEDRLRAHSLRCVSCRRTVGALAAVSELGRGEPASTPPAHVFSEARDLFPARAPVADAKWPRLAGLLIFDSWQQPAFAGVRSQAAGERHVTYRSGPWEVDLKLESSAEQLVSVLGQVGWGTGRPSLPLDGVPVRLVSGRKALASTTLNEYGEFQLNCEAPGKGLRLDIPISSGRVRLDIPLTAAPTAPESSRAPRTGRSTTPKATSRRTGK